MPVKHIISYANDGLGGRLLCLMNALMISKYYECKASLLWKNNNALACDYSKLFKSNKAFEVYSNIRDIPVEDTLEICCIQVKLIKNYNDIRDFINGIEDRKKYLETLRSKSIKHKKLRFFSRRNRTIIKDIKKALTKDDTCIFCSRGKLNQYYNISYRDIFNDYLSPVDSIQFLIESFINSNNYFNNILGVQVRRGDLVNSNDPIMMKRLIPTESYFETIDVHLRTGNYKKIFLAAESNEVISEFKDRYKNKIITYPIGDYSRNEEGVVSALIDILLLSKCSLIISGPGGMANAAARIGNVERCVLSQ